MLLLLLLTAVDDPRANHEDGRPDGCRVRKSGARGENDDITRRESDVSHAGGRDRHNARRRSGVGRGRNVKNGVPRTETTGRHQVGEIETNERNHSLTYTAVRYTLHSRRDTHRRYTTRRRVHAANAHTHTRDDEWRRLTFPRAPVLLLSSHVITRTYAHTTGPCDLVFLYVISTDYGRCLLRRRRRGSNSEILFLDVGGRRQKRARTDEVCTDGKYALVARQARGLRHRRVDVGTRGRATCTCARRVGVRLGGRGSGIVDEGAVEGRSAEAKTRRKIIIVIIL